MIAFIGTNTISPRLLSDEFALTIALVVFVMLTAVLLTLLIALIASKNFRKVFFRDKPKKPEKRPRAADKNAESAANVNASAGRSDYFEGIPTVPIGAPPESLGQTKRSDEAEPEIYDKIPTVALPEIDKQNSVYTVRNTPNARAKTAASSKTTVAGGKTKSASQKTSASAASKTAASAKTKKTANASNAKKR